MTSWPTSTTPAPATGPPKPSTAESNTCAAQPLASEIYSTTSPEHSWTPADSEPKYTHFYDEPHKTNNSSTFFSHAMHLIRGAQDAAGPATRIWRRPISATWPLF